MFLGVIIRGSFTYLFTCYIKFGWMPTYITWRFITLMNERASYIMYTQRNNNRGGYSRQKPRSKGGRNKQNINENKFINRNTTEATQSVSEYVPTHKFADFGFATQLQQNLDFIKFESPSAIQDQTIAIAMEGKDVIGLANTGTGKTAAFLLPIINNLYKTREINSVLIMAPTRELATQIDDEFRRFAAGMKLFSVLLVGGMNMMPQLRGLSRGPHVIIGTPGRIKDHLNRRSLRLGNVSHFVLDEADRMLDMGFVADIRAIADQLPAERQTFCFSATLSTGVQTIAHDLMHDPEFVSVKVTETNDHIYQDVVHYNSADNRKDLLMEMLGKDEFEKVIIFGETKHGVQRLSDSLSGAGVASQAIHGNKSQSQRTRALQDFKTNKARVLVATDVAARGLDIPNVSHVINYDVPQTYDDYVHRIGRTGRAGKTGVAWTFVAEPGARIGRESYETREPRGEFRGPRQDRSDRNSRPAWRDNNAGPRRTTGAKPAGARPAGAKPQAARNSRKPRHGEDSLMAAISELGK